MTIKHSGYLNNNGATRITENNNSNGDEKVRVDGDTKATKSEKTKFTFKKKTNSQTITTPVKKKFAFKKKSVDYFKMFTNLCLQNNLRYFQFYDTNKWTGPAIKVLEDDFTTVTELFENNLPNKTVILNGLGFVIIRPIHKMCDDKINYTNTDYSELKFTDSPIIPYNSDTEDDSDDEISIEEEFIAEEWVYNQTTYILDPKTNYLYFPSTFEFIGKKTDEFSIDFNAKEL